MKIKAFGSNKKGESATLYIFENKNGMEMHVSDFGATLQKLIIPDRNQKKRDVVLGYDDPMGYEGPAGTFFGATVGRHANRIGNASFEYNGIVYCLDKNNGNNNLHSGYDFWSFRIWKVKETTENSITFSLHSPDGDQGYPGNVDVDVQYTLTEDNGILIHYFAVTDQDTPINMTNHSYFNLCGHESGTVRDQIMWIDADGFTRTNAELIPTGEIVPVEKTPMDFRAGKKVGLEIDNDYEEMLISKKEEVDKYKTAIKNKYLSGLSDKLIEYDKFYRTVSYLENDKLFSTRKEADVARKDLEYIKTVMKDVTAPTKESLFDYKEDIEQRIAMINDNTFTIVKNPYLQLLQSHIESFNKLYLKTGAIFKSKSLEDASRKKFKEKFNFNAMDMSSYEKIDSIWSDIEEYIVKINMSKEQLEIELVPIYTAEKTLNTVDGYVFDSRELAGAARDELHMVNDILNNITFNDSIELFAIFESANTCYLVINDIYYGRKA